MDKKRASKKLELPEAVISLAWLSAKRVIAALADGQLCVIDAEQAALLESKQAFKFGCSTLAVDPQGKFIACGGQEPILKVFFADSLQPSFGSTFGGSAWVEHVAWSRDGEYLAAAAGKQLRMLRRDGTLVRDYEPFQRSISDINFRDDEPELAAATYGGLRTFRPEGPVPKRNLAWKGSLLTVRWSPGGEYLACGTQENSLHCWSVAKVKEFEMSGFLTKVRELSWHNSGKALAVGGGGAVTIWDFRAGPPLGKQPVVIEGHVDLISAIAFSRWGDGIASVGNDGFVIYWHPDLKQPERLYEAPAAATCLAWSPDDQTLAVGFQDGRLALVHVDFQVVA